MKKLLLLFLLATPAFAIDKPIPCDGASCKLKFETRDGSNVKVSAGQFSSTGLTLLSNTTGDSNLGTISSVVNGAYYEGTFPINWTGAQTISVTARYVKAGKMVTVFVPQVLPAACSASSFTASAAIPSGLRVSGTNIRVPIFSNSGGVPTTIMSDFQFNGSNGNLAINLSNNVSAFASTCGYGDFSFSYPIH